MAVMGTAAATAASGYEDEEGCAAEVSDEMPWTSAAAASWEAFCLEMAELCDLCETFGIRLPRDLMPDGMRRDT